jgi:Kyakuja-Dileera-Zisupton transposase
VYSGADFHVAVDANFHHRHHKSAGDIDLNYIPEYIIPKTQVDAVGERIAHLRPRSQPKKAVNVPKEAIDECEKSYEAADGNKEKANGRIYDDTGLCALVCHHDIPLFVANVDTPGEQQKYAIALIEHLFGFIPPTSTVEVLYDIGCVLERSLNNVGEISSEVCRNLNSHKEY